MSLLQSGPRTFDIHQPQHVSSLLVEGSDRHIWKLEAHDKFFIKSFVRAIRTRESAGSPSIHIWDSRLTLKLSLFMWKLHNDFLGTDNIQKRMGFLLASQYGCKNGEDNINHIFLHCKHANYLSRESACLLGIFPFPFSSFNTISDCLLFWWDRDKGSSSPSKFFPIIICWVLWKNHCSFYFEGTSSTTSQLWRSFFALITDISKARNLNFTPSPSTDTTTAIRLKQPSNTHSLVLNVDGASKGNPRVAVARGVLRHIDGSFIRRFSHYLGDKCSNSFAEVMAILFRISMAAEMGFSSFLLQSDSFAVVPMV